MGLAATQARLNVCILSLANVEARLMQISARRQRMSAAQSEAAAKYSAELTEFNLKKINNGEDSAITYMSFESTEAYADYQKTMAELEAAENVLDMEQKLLDTQNNALNSEKQACEKLLESNIKESFSYFKS